MAQLYMYSQLNNLYPEILFHTYITTIYIKFTYMHFKEFIHSQSFIPHISIYMCMFTSIIKYEKIFVKETGKSEIFLTSGC